MTIGAMILVLAMIVFMAIGAPIYLSILLSASTTIAATGLNFQTIIQRLYSANDNFPLLAVPFFFIAGELMLQGGIAKRIVGFCKVLFGRIEGNLAIITFAACAFFGAISGSSYATTASIGKLMYPEMCQEGYEKRFSAALQAVGGTLGVLIPPSLLCVIYGVATGASVGDMLLWILPVGLFVTLIYIFTALIMIRSPHSNVYSNRNTAQTKRYSFKEVLHHFLDAFWSLLTPVIILGGIYTGIFTPTECAVVATVYAWIIGSFVYKELDLKTSFKAIQNAIIGSAAIIMIVNAAGVFSWLITVNRVASTVANLVQSGISTQVGFMLLVNIVYLFAGMFVEGSVTITIITPLLFPIAMAFGINPIHFGVVTVLNCILGTLTPPFGGALFVTTGVTKIPVTDLLHRVWPFLLSGFAACLLVTFIPLLWL